MTKKGRGTTIEKTISRKGDVIMDVAKGIDMKLFDEPAFVNVKIGATLNAGNYESVRLDIGITMPCHPDEIDDTFLTVRQRIEEKMKTELPRLKAMLEG